MKVVLIKACSSGKAGEVLTGASSFRLAFPTKGCAGRPADAEALEAVERDINSTTGPTKERLLVEMEKGGTYPVPELLPKPAPLPSVKIETLAEPVKEVKQAEPVVVKVVEEKPADAEAPSVQAEDVKAVSKSKGK